MRLSLPALFVLALLNISTAAATEWKFSGETQGIKLYTREVAGADLKDFKGVMEVDAPLAQVAATLADVPKMNDWFFMLREAKYLDNRPLDNSYVYLELKGIWPVSPRDAAVHVTVEQNAATREVLVNIEAVPKHVPKQDGKVRIPSMHSSWRLTPVSAGKTRVELIGNADPGGWIPVAIANMVVTTMPKESLKGMKNYLAKPEYKDVKVAYARNPRLGELMSRLNVE